MKDVVCYEKAN